MVKNGYSNSQEYVKATAPTLVGFLFYTLNSWHVVHNKNIPMLRIFWVEEMLSCWLLDVGGVTHTTICISLKLIEDLKEIIFGERVPFRNQHNSCHQRRNE